MYDAAAPLFLQTLRGLSTVLAKGHRFAEARSLDETVLLEMRLYPDMFPLRAQVEQCVRHAVRGMATLAGQPVPEAADKAVDLVALKAQVDDAIDYVSGFAPEALEGSEAREVAFNSPRGVFHFTGQQFLFNLVIPNVMFHAATAYGLLRSLGVEIGKMDFVGRTTA
jgi:hypothetical protein